MNDDVKGAKPQKTQGTGKGLRIVFILAVLFVCFLGLGFVGGSVYAFFSNKNVPVFSDVVEKVENVAVSESAEDEMIQDDVNDFIFSSLVLPMVSEDGVVNTELTKDQVEAFINEKYDVDSYRFDIDMSMAMEEEGTITVGVDGWTNTLEDVSHTDATISGGYEIQGLSLELGGKLLMVGDQAFVRVDALPVDMLAGMGIDANGLTDVWLKLESDDSEGLLGLTGMDVSTEGDFSKGDLELIQELIYSDEMADIIERVGDEVVEGVRTNCFRVYAEEPELAALIAKGNELAGGESMDKSDLGISKLDATVCVGRKDGNIYKFEASVEGDNGMIVSMGGKMWDYDSVEDEVVAPEGAVTVEELMTSLMQQQQQDMTGGGVPFDISEMSEEEILQIQEQYDITDEEMEDYMKMMDQM